MKHATYSDSSRARRRPRSVARWFGRGLVWLALGVLLLVALALVCINVTPVSRLVRSQLNALLETTFQGQLIVHRIGQIDFDGITGAELEVRDAQGQPVLAARGIDLRLFWPALVARFVAGDDTLDVPIRELEIQQLDVTVIDDGAGLPTLAHAFDPRQPDPPGQDTAATRVSVARLTVASTRIRGELESLRPIDAELHDLKARLLSEPAGFELELQELDLEARQLPHIDRVTGQLRGEVWLPAPPAPQAAAAPLAVESDGLTTEIHALRPAGSLRRVRLDFAGTVADSSAELDLSWIGQQIAGGLRAPELSPATLRQLLPALSPSAPVSLVASLRGQPDDLELEARLAQAAARVNATGRLRGEGPSNRLSLRVDASHVDLARLLPDVPSTQLRLVADAQLDSDGSGSRGSYRVVCTGSSVGAALLPRATLTGEIELFAARPLETRGGLAISEPGAATRLDYSFAPGPHGSRLRIDSSTELDRPARLRERLGVNARGQIAVRAELDSEADRLDAEANVRLRELQHPAFTLGRLTASVQASGSASAPELWGRADARRVAAGGRRLSRVSVSARGTPERASVSGFALAEQARARVRGPERVEWRASISPGSVLRIDQPRLRVYAGGDQLLLAARAVRVAPERLEVQRLSLDGAGRADLSLEYGHTLEQLELRTRALDVARLLRIFGVQSQLRSGWADLEARVSNRGGQPSGTLVGNIRQIGFAELKGSLSADLGLEHGRVNGDARFELMPGGTTEIELRDLRLPLTLRSSDLEQLRGDVALKGELELARLQSLLPLAGIERAEGRLSYAVALRGSQPGEPADLRAHVESQGLVLVGERPDVGQTKDAEQARRSAPWSVRDLDLSVDVSLERSSAQASGKLFDAKGVLLTWGASWSDLRRGQAFVLHRDTLLETPFRAELRVPARALEELPASIRPTDIEGRLALALDAQGTLRDPRLSARVTLERFTPASNRRRQQHLDLNLDAEVAPAGGRMALTALRRTEPVLELDSRWTGDARRLAAATGKSPVLAALELELNEFPLGAVPPLQQRRVRGRLSGKASLVGLGQDARVELDLRTRDLSVERLVLGELHAMAHGAGGRLEIETEIDGKAGQVQARFSAPLLWGDRLLPTSDGQLDGSLHTRALRLRALEPLVEGSISELDGKLDAELRAQLQGGTTRVSGQARLSEGALHVPSVGQAFSDISAEVHLTPGALRIERIKARGLTGGFEASASATLDGLAPTSAEASLRIKEDDKLPLTLEGASLGDVWGSLHARFRRDAGALTNTVQVQLEGVHVELPEAPPSGLQALDQPEYIRVGYRRRDGEFTPIALQPLEEAAPSSEEKTVVLVDLGNLALRKGQQARVSLGGNLEATLADELDVRGRIETRRGELDISGKTFEIERGSVAFTGGEPDEPLIAAVARYDAPAGYTVYAEYTGTPSEGKLQLRSEPPLSQDEIVTLLLFGSPDGSLGAGAADSFSTAISVAGGTAAQGLNRALSDVTDLDVSARVDTSTGAPRPELVLQLTPRVAAKVTQALGEPVPGQSPDRTFVTIDLRLASNWSLSTTVGDRGASAFDLIWRTRY